MSHALGGIITAIALALVAATGTQTTAVSRPYWRVPLDTLAIGHRLHTHMAITGVVTYTRLEEDGDLHIRLTSPNGRFIIAECIPKLPCIRPRIGATITVYGIQRQDPEHLWFEIHPVETLQ